MSRNQDWWLFKMTFIAYDLSFNLPSKANILTGFLSGSSENLRPFQRGFLSLATYARQPFTRSSNQCGKDLLNILEVIQLCCLWAHDIDGDDLPFDILVRNHRQSSKHLDLFNLSDLPNLIANLAYGDKIVVATRIRI